LAGDFDGTHGIARDQQPNDSFVGGNVMVFVDRKR